MKYLKFGNSKTFIIYLHGWGSSKDSFLWLKNYFTEYTQLFVDFAGFGESEEPNKSYSVFDYVLELKSILDCFDIESLILVGHSFGGRVAIKFLSLYQFNYKFSKLCLIDSAGIKPRRSFLYYYRIYKFKLLRKIAKMFKFMQKSINNMGSSDYKCLSPIMKETFKLVVNEDLSNDAAKIQTKTIIVWGGKDKETKIYMAKRLKRLIKKSELYVFKNAGHFSFLDCPEEFLIILDTFIKNL